MHSFEVREVEEKLVAAGGGYEVVHASPGLEVGVYVLVAPEPDRQQPHDDDEVYVVLSGRGVLMVEGVDVALEEGQAVFVEAGAEHRFTGYEGSRSSSSSPRRGPRRRRSDARSSRWPRVAADRCGRVLRRLPARSRS